MNITGIITGQILSDDRKLINGSEAFYANNYTRSETYPKLTIESYTNNYNQIRFDASRSWTGVIFIQISSHTHSRGSQNITGGFYSKLPANYDESSHSPQSVWGYSASFTTTIADGSFTGSFQSMSGSAKANKIIFDASRSWTGEKKNDSTFLFYGIY